MVTWRVIISELIIKLNNRYFLVIILKQPISKVKISYPLSYGKLLSNYFSIYYTDQLQI